MMTELQVTLYLVPILAFIRLYGRVLERAFPLRIDHTLYFTMPDTMHSPIMGIIIVMTAMVGVNTLTGTYPNYFVLFALLMVSLWLFDTVEFAVVWGWLKLSPRKQQADNLHDHKRDEQRTDEHRDNKVPLH